MTQEKPMFDSPDRCGGGKGTPASANYPIGKAWKAFDNESFYLTMVTCFKSFAGHAKRLIRCGLSDECIMRVFPAVLQLQKTRL